jgi:hypothetical protein
MSTAAPATLDPRLPRQRRRAVIMVFNPTHFADDVPVAGHFFHFEPKSVGQCLCAHHQRAVGEDPTGVHEILDWPRTERGQLVTDGGLRAREVVLSAEKVADIIVGPECRGAKGYVTLEGSPAEQEEQKAAAVQKWVTFHLADVEQTIAGWEAHVADLRQMRPGDPPPRRPRHVVAAYQFRDNHLEMIGRVAKYVCSLCGWDGLEAIPPRPDTAESLAGHVRQAHPGVALPEVAPEPAPAPAANRPPTQAELDEERTLESMGDDPNSQVLGNAAAPAGSTPVERKPDPEGEALTQRAKQLKMPLSVADLKGLQFGDPDVVKDVTARLEAFKKAAKKAAAAQ